MRSYLCSSPSATLSDPTLGFMCTHSHGATTIFSLVAPRKLLHMSNSPTMNSKNTSNIFGPTILSVERSSKDGYLAETDADGAVVAGTRG